MIVVLSGGVGAARFLRGMVAEAGDDSVAAVVNVADDFELYGLYISPDIDTIMYTLTDQVGPEGWGLRDESWGVMNALSALTPTWFQLGDKDLATHLYRTQRMRDGATLSCVTRELCALNSLEIKVVPVTDDKVTTRVRVDGEWIDFQEYFVARANQPRVTEIEFSDISNAKPNVEALELIEKADRIFIAPSNPFVSIDPILKVPGIARAVSRRRNDVVAISPIVDGGAIKGPAARMLSDFGYESSVVSIAQLWNRFAATLVVDDTDAHLEAGVESHGMRCVATSTMIPDLETSRRLAQHLLAL